ncbi:MAG: STAS domain-containing protein [Acidobacteriaceae bacterium]
MLNRLVKRPSSLQGRIISGSFVLLSGSGLATVINFAYNVAVARFLGPKGFGHATAVYTLLTFISAITLSFQIISAKIVAQQPSPEAKSAGYRSFHRQAWACGIVAALILLLFRRGISDYLNLPSPILILFLTVGAAFYVPLGCRRGYLQGAYGFRRLATNLVIEGAVRLGGSVLLVLLGFGVGGVILANSAAVAVAYFAIVPKLAARIPNPLHFSYAARELLQALIFFSGQVLINNCDIVLVKHFFVPRSAGIYAAVAMVGRVIFTFSQSVVNSMFPLVAGSREEDRRDFRVIATALLMVLAIGSGIALVLRLTPPWVWRDFLGSNFEIAGKYNMSYLLALYAITTVTYCLSAVIITYEMSYKIANTSWVQLAFSAVVIAGICLFHSSLRQVILVQLVLMALLLFFVALPFLVNSLTDSNKMDPSESLGPLKIIRRVSEDQVISEFLKSDFGHAIFRDYQDTLRNIVMQPNLEDALENAKRRSLFFMRHLALWSELPAGVEWREVEITDADLRQIRVFPRAQWRRVGRGNFRITDIAERLRLQNPEVDDPFVSKLIAIRNRFFQDAPGLGPIILIGTGEHAPLTILDGNHRLVAAMLGPVSGVESLRFLCGLSPKMNQCCWYNTNLVTLFRYARDVLRGSFRRPEEELNQLLQHPDSLGLDVAIRPADLEPPLEQKEETMSIPMRNVVVKRMPKEASGRPGRAFLREVRECVEVDRPRIVLDCSNLRQMDKSVVHLLLCCLEEAMKRNGDVRLAALPMGADALLETTGAGRLFEVYDTAAEAVKSFHRPLAGSVAPTAVAVRPDLESESAA